MLYENLEKCQVWTNNSYYFYNNDNNSSINCSLNILTVNEYKGKTFDSELTLCSIYTLFIPLISKYTNCKIWLMNLKYRKELLNKTFNPIKSVEENITNLALFEAVLDTKRAKIARYTRIFLINNLISLMSVERSSFSNSFELFSIFSIFEPISWLFFLVLLLLYSIFNVIFSNKKTNKVVYFLNSIIYYLEPFFTSSMYLNENEKSLTRICLVLWAFGCLLLSSFFTNDVLARILSQPKILVDDFTDVNKYSLTVLNWDGSYITRKNLLINSTAKIKNINTIEYFNYKNIIQTLIQGKYVQLLGDDRALFICELVKQKYQIPLHISSHRQYPVLQTFLMSKDLPNRIYYKMDLLIRNLIESGLLDFWKKVHLSFNFYNISLIYGDYANVKPIELKSVLPLFYILTYFMGFAFFVIIFEIFYCFLTNKIRCFN